MIKIPSYSFLIFDLLAEPFHLRSRFHYSKSPYPHLSPLILLHSILFLTVLLYPIQFPLALLLIHPIFSLFHLPVRSYLSFLFLITTLQILNLLHLSSFLLVFPSLYILLRFHLRILHLHFPFVMMSKAVVVEPGFPYFFSSRYFLAFLMFLVNEASKIKT